MGRAQVGVCSCWLLSLRRAGICVGAHPGQKGQLALSGNHHQLASQPLSVILELHACLTASRCLCQSEVQTFTWRGLLVGAWHWQHAVRAGLSWQHSHSVQLSSLQTICKAGLSCYYCHCVELPSLQTSDCTMSRLRPKAGLANPASKTLDSPSPITLTPPVPLHARQAGDDAVKHFVTAPCCMHLIS